MDPPLTPWNNFFFKIDNQGEKVYIRISFCRQPPINVPLRLLAHRIPVHFATSHGQRLVADKARTTRTQNPFDYQPDALWGMSSSFSLLLFFL